MTIYTPHTPKSPSDCCEIVAVLKDGRVKVEIVRKFASGTKRTGQERIYWPLQLAADRGRDEIAEAIEAVRQRPSLPPADKLAHDIRVTGRVPYDPSRED